MATEIVLILLACHLLSVLASYIVVRKQGDAIQGATEAAIVLLMPVAGLVMVWGNRLLRAAGGARSHIDPHKLMNQNNVFTNMISYDENVIPLHDTYLVEDVQARRKVFLDAVKQNVLENPRVLKMATKDKDREIAYYAVSMISGHVEELEAEMQQLEADLSKNAGNLELLQEYAGVLQDYLSQDYVDKITKKEKGQIYAHVLENLLAAEPDNIEYIQEKINIEMKLENYQKAQENCEAFQQLYPDREEPYIAYMRLYFAVHNGKKLQEKLQELRRIPGTLSSEALRLVRYWGGAVHE